MNAMATTIPATFADGVFRPDGDVALPENSRVLLTIQAATPRRSPADAFAAFKARALERPIKTGGKRFSRDELHERG